MEARLLSLKVLGRFSPISVLLFEAIVMVVIELLLSSLGC